MIRRLTSRRRHEFDEEVLACANDGVWELTHAAEGPYYRVTDVFSVVNLDVIVRTVFPS